MREVKPITAEELIEFRELIYGEPSDGAPARTDKGTYKPGQTDSASHHRQLLGLELGVTAMSLWRWEQGEPIRHPVVLRRALVNVAESAKRRVPNRLRFG